MFAYFLCLVLIYILLNRKEKKIIHRNQDTDRFEIHYGGYLEIFTGPMFSGKTQHMIRRLTDYADIYGKKCLIVNSSIDNRDSVNTISSHSSAYKGVSDKIAVVSTPELSLVDTSGFEVIGIDEAQFYSNLKDIVLWWRNEGKIVVVAGLSTDSNLRPFGEISKLLHLADSFTCLTSICHSCLQESKSSPAAFSKRVNLRVGDSQIDVGNIDKYEAACWLHFNS